MIKWPEAVNQSLAEDIASLDCRYRGSPSYEHDAFYMRKAAEDLVSKGYPIYTQAQLKQYGRDLLEEAAQACRQTCSAENNVFGDGYNTGAYQCEKNLRALIKEIQ